METLQESSEEDAYLSPSFATVSPHHLLQSNRDVSVQTKEVFGFSLALRQLQEVTQAKAQLEWRLALELEMLDKNYKYQQFEMVWEQEDQ